VNWKSFLESDLGGGWLATDIEIYRKPSRAQITAALPSDADCYCFIAFSGHGFEGHIVLNEQDEAFPISSLKPKVEKSTIIIDSCRGVGDGSERSKNKIIAEASGSVILANSARGLASEFDHRKIADAMMLRNVARISATANWYTALAKSNKGVVEMLACSKGEAAGEDARAGGYYTSLLLQSADIWNTKSTTTKIHTTKDAHDYAAPLLPPQQKPEYRPTWLSFPFASKA